MGLLSGLSQAPVIPTARDEVSVQRPWQPPETQGPKAPGQQGQPPYFPAIQLGPLGAVAKTWAAEAGAWPP